MRKVRIAYITGIIAAITLSLHPALSAETLGTPLTLAGAVRLAEKQYPKLLQAQDEAYAAKAGVRVQKIREYMPRTTLMYETVVGTHNRLSQTIFGNEVLPQTPGPGPETIQMKAHNYGADGFIVDWAPLDFGLHQARIRVAKTRSEVQEKRFLSSVLDTQVEAATRYLDAMLMKQQLDVAEANFSWFNSFRYDVAARVQAKQRSHADESLAETQLIDARNNMIRARLNYELAEAALAQVLGVPGQPLNLAPGGLALVTEPHDTEPPATFVQHPLAREASASVALTVAERYALSKEGFPTLRWLGGMNFRGSTLRKVRGDVEVKDSSAFLPYAPNWNIGLIVEWRPSELVRLAAEKRVVDFRVSAARHGYDNVVQVLQTQDVQARARVRAATQLAAGLPEQVRAAETAAAEAEARYRRGLATVAQAAEANRLLAESRVKLAVANVGVWKALLQQATVVGNLNTFLAQTDQATQSR